MGDKVACPTCGKIRDKINCCDYPFRGISIKKGVAFCTECEASSKTMKCDRCGKRFTIVQGLKALMTRPGETPKSAGSRLSDFVIVVIGAAIFLAGVYMASEIIDMTGLVVTSAFVLFGIIVIIVGLWSALR